MKCWGKKLAALVLCAVMVSGILPGLMPTAKAELQGSGSEADPYLIGSAADLKAFRDIVNGDDVYSNFACARLTADIDLGNEEWTPISKNRGYAGTFDGNYHTIFNHRIDAEDKVGQGFFYSIGKDASVKNLALNGSV